MGNMQINDFFDSENFLNLEFDEILNAPNSELIISNLIYLVGYNHIEIEHEQPNLTVFNAGMFTGDLDQKLKIENGKLEGKLLDVANTVFNTLKDIKKESDISDYYSPEMRKLKHLEILKKNNIDPSFLKELRMRLVL
ncbi:hypothetical protein [Pseudoalteromonas sp. NSLLW218]|uniref:hypothetical protein n=1 Tax=Pseudoalteromonas sp. NSLLW218 TaxID=2792048 RepID=UPI0018CFD37C|nr:hypothetical protein [Pseudoalteromonas sp. NSLLW218]MBH0087661.1 hypothetical protein [Pseudoalteromonas sp. NSLLW218]